jgi:hypothetical protein
MEPWKITQKILFLGEQDGAIERELKAKLTNCFTSKQTVSSAYLVRVSYEEAPGPQVALCIRSGEGPAMELVECSGKIFGSLFDPREHLDIFFLSETQLAVVEQVAKPFYAAST